ncbi:hypothetical protein ACQXR1_07845 [Bacillus sp. ATD]|uniref:hypothetical protein n=1 Tax=Bacillus sp. ATD TaxID=3422305 RepID=UPI003D33E75C
MKKLEKCYEYTIQFFSKHIDKLSELIDDVRFELTVDEPDVEAMHDELILTTWLKWMKRITE